jgi:DNA polymerase III epsilon subunit-like protein
MASVISFLEGKNVFIFDTETTGLPLRVPGAKWGSTSEYWPYNMNEKYDSARIVSIAWSFIPTFNKSTLPEQPIQSAIRFPPPEILDIPTSHIHGITYEMAKQQGIPFADILEDNDNRNSYGNSNNCGGLENAILNAEYIIAHNVMFDVHILLNELWRLGNDSAIACIAHINKLLAMGRCICSGELGRGICKIPYKNSKRYKMPKLVELYRHFFECEFEGQHSADGDVRALLYCLSRM